MIVDRLTLDAPPGYLSGRHGIKTWQSSGEDVLRFSVSVVPRGWSDRATYTGPHAVTGTYALSLADMEPSSSGFVRRVMKAHRGEA